PEREPRTIGDCQQAGISVRTDWQTGRRWQNPHETARIVQLFRGGGGGSARQLMVRQTRDLPACFASQERRLMRCLSTVQGQLFTIVKLVFKRMLPSMGAAGLTSYHAKTVLFFLLARHARRRSWWTVENLLPLVRKTLHLTLELLELDARPCVAMPHFFADNSQLSFRDPSVDTKLRVRESLSALCADPKKVDDFLRKHLRPVVSQRQPLFFHPFTLLPADFFSLELMETPNSDSATNQAFADVYLLVQQCLSDLSSSSQADKQSRLTRISCLPAWCLCSRQCLTALAWLSFGDRTRATKVLVPQTSHRVQRYWDSERCCFFDGLLSKEGAAGGVLYANPSNCGDWGWRFCFSSRGVRVALKELPQFTQALLQPRPDSLDPNWYAEMKFDPDHQELLTLAHYSDSPLHLHFCRTMLEELRNRSRLDLSCEIEAVQTKLSRLTRGSDGWNGILSRNGARHMRLPMVLTCGHNVCTECVLSSLRQKSDSWTCRVDGCQVATKYNQPLNKLNTIPVGVLPLDLNLIGMFYSDMLIRLTQKSDVRKSSGDEDRGEASKEFTVPGAGIARDRSACSACKAVQSSVKCAECNDSLFCHSCFREFHNQLGFSHQIEPAVTTQLLKPAEDPVCSSAVSHSSAVPANIFCVTCASLICSACQQSSEHADHSTCEFGQANMRLLRWLLSIADSLESLANRLVESEQTLLSETARLESETTSSLQSEVRADFSILYARLISAENDAVCRLRQSGVLAPLAQQSEQLLAELRRCADWLLPLSLSLKALRSAGSDAIARWCPVKPFDYARLLQLLSSLTNQPVCVLPPNVTAVSSAGASAAASMPQLCRRSDTQPFDLAHFSIASPARLQACPPASLEPGIEHLLANSPAGIFCDSGLLEQPSVQQESLSNPLPKAAVVAEEADSAAPTTMPVPLSTGDAVIPLFLLSPREIWVARYAEQAWLKRTQQLCSQAAKSQLAVQTETVQSGDWVLSRFQSASDWCRAIVTKLNIESAVCDVFFPDYGNSVSNKQIAELLTMPPALCEIPPLAHRISLNNIAPRVMNNGPTSQQQPDQWSTEA
uniref:B box-type domain-containing protein n=1 Tax=Macrostomum lignano TaxID=282301 RepID=A0A1I8ITB3_9PLAT